MLADFRLTVGIGAGSIDKVDTRVKHFIKYRAGLIHCTALDRQRAKADNADFHACAT
ncbi:hypothetical protein SDC9_74082 [bioreactor metagenome]|uniref:Uncharacterized protein n=1 Tax=bioreactor metagenome TaxID=1076179 RepID=A0A644YGJ0_9ZZZZ